MDGLYSNPSQAGHAYCLRNGHGRGRGRSRRRSGSRGRSRSRSRSRRWPVPPAPAPASAPVPSPVPCCRSCAILCSPACRLSQSLVTLSFLVARTRHGQAQTGRQGHGRKAKHRERVMPVRVELLTEPSRIDGTVPGRVRAEGRPGGRPRGRGPRGRRPWEHRQRPAIFPRHWAACTQHNADEQGPLARGSWLSEELEHLMHMAAPAKHTLHSGGHSSCPCYGSTDPTQLRRCLVCLAVFCNPSSLLPIWTQAASLGPDCHYPHAPPTERERQCGGRNPSLRRPAHRCVTIPNMQSHFSIRNSRPQRTPAKRTH